MQNTGNTISDRRSRANQFFWVALGLINTLTFTLIICCIGFLMGLTISGWQFPAGCLLALLVNYYFGQGLSLQNGHIAILQGLSAIVGIIILCISLASLTYDISFDGQWYHQQTIQHLHENWNPFYQQLSVPAAEQMGPGADVWCSGTDKPSGTGSTIGHPLVNLKYININHFPKGIEIIETAIYRVSRRIEAGKAVNGIFLAANFFLALSLLCKIRTLRIRKNYLLAALIAFNPIAITQLLSFCVDGVMACSVCCLVIACCLLYREVSKHYLFLLGSLIILSLNIKFSSLLFTFIYCAGLILALWVDKRGLQCRKTIYLCVVAGIIGFFFCGFHPYITNFTSKQDPFYGLQQTRIEIKSITPPLFKDLNRFEKLFFSLAAHSDSHAADQGSLLSLLKIPFSVSGRDWGAANDPEVKLAAFGPFFSGALLLAIALFFIMRVRLIQTEGFVVLSVILLLTLITVILIPDAWWGRFVPQLWLIPVSILAAAESIVLKRGQLLRTILRLALGLNILWSLLSIVYNLFVTAHIDYQLSQLKKYPLPVGIEYCPYRSFRSNAVRFKECHIQLTESEASGPYIYNVIHSNSRLSTPSPLPALQKPLLLRLSEGLKTGE